MLRAEELDSDEEEIPMFEDSDEEADFASYYSRYHRDYEDYHYPPDSDSDSDY